MKPVVGVLGVFDTLQSAYSVANVVIEQVKALCRYEYKTVLFMVDEGPWATGKDTIVTSLQEECGEYLTIRPISRVILKDYQDTEEVIGDEFNNVVNTLLKSFKAQFKDIDVMLAHDMLFQTWFLPHNIAIRKLSEEYPKIKWVHWSHSAPSYPSSNIIEPHTARFSGMNHSLFIFLNHGDATKMAAMRNIPERAVYVIPNSRDICDYLGMQATTKKFIRDNDLLKADILIVYPTRMCSAKQPNKVVLLAAALKSFDRNVKLVFVNSYSSSFEEKELIKELQNTASRTGLEDSVYFTSLAGIDSWVEYCPAECVKDLQQLADVFVLPSISEACSLITLEAAICRNLVVLNEDFLPMSEVLQHNALYAKFGSIHSIVRHTDENGNETEEAEIAYYKQIAGRMLYELQVNRVMAGFSAVKKDYNADAIFTKYIEPLIYA